MSSIDAGKCSNEDLSSILSQLHGTKICIRGNHDATPSKMHTIGFALVLESAFIKIGRHAVELIHIPSTPPPPHFQLHGHVHEKRPNKLIDRQLNLSVEVWNYRPVPEKTIVAMLDRAENPISSSGSKILNP